MKRRTKKKIPLYHKCDCFPNDSPKLILFDKTTNHASFTAEDEFISFPVYKTCCHFAKDINFTKKVDLSEAYPILRLNR